MFSFIITTFSSITFLIGGAGLKRREKTCIILHPIFTVHIFAAFNQEIVLRIKTGFSLLNKKKSPLTANVKILTWKWMKTMLSNSLCPLIFVPPQDFTRRVDFVVGEIQRETNKRGEWYILLFVQFTDSMAQTLAK